MDNVYGNVDFELSTTGRSKRCTDVSEHTSRSVRDWNTPSKETLKFLLAALSFVLLCAVVALCVLGVMYFNKREQHKGTGQRLSVQEHSTTETERKYEALKVKYRTVHKVLSNCSACQKCALCENGWRSFGVKCYYFSTNTVNWMKSRDDCAQKGGHLAIITSQAEQEFVLSAVNKTHWIGLNDLETEGRWMWVDNQSLSETGVTFWFKRKDEPDEPDNWKYEDPSGENCASLGNEGGHTHSWFDSSCGKIKKYICEK